MKRIAIKDSQAQVQKKIIHRLRDRLAGKTLHYFLSTFGCQMNSHDSEKLKGILEDIGFQETSEERKADLVLYNTCAVRENAENKVYGRVGHLKTLKKKNPDLIIVLCGCMMQQDVVINKLKESYSYVDIVFGTHNVYKLAELLESYLDTKTPIYDIWDSYEDIVEDLPIQRKEKYKASVNIMFGCNNFCSYCIVPYVRGRERSRKPEDILEEIKALVADGVVEIMLLGQNVNSYGKGLDQAIDFTGLLKEIEKIDGLERVRFMTSHPKDLSDDLIAFFGQSKKLANQLHLPLQSGSNKILKKMKRRYSKESYLEIVDKIRHVKPDIGLTTDIIVGFPGETEEDFNETMDVVEKVAYDSAFTFIYSKRTGTPAALMEDQVDEKVIKARFSRLLDTVNEKAELKSKAHVGKTYSVLVEEVNQNTPGKLSGRLSNNHLVHFNGPASYVGKMVNVRITSAKMYYLNGQLDNQGEPHGN